MHHKTLERGEVDNMGKHYSFVFTRIEVFCPVEPIYVSFAPLLLVSPPPLFFSFTPLPHPHPHRSPAPPTAPHCIVASNCMMFDFEYVWSGYNNNEEGEHQLVCAYYTRVQAYPWGRKKGRRKQRSRNMDEENERRHKRRWKRKKKGERKERKRREDTDEEKDKVNEESNTK